MVCFLSYILLLSSRNLFIFYRQTDGGGSSREGRGGSTGKTPGMGNLNLNMMCEKKSIFNKSKNNKLKVEMLSMFSNIDGKINKILINLITY